MATRQEKGREIAFSTPERVQRSGRFWKIYGSRSEPYTVDPRTGGCTCPDKRFSGDEGHRCKHWWSIYYASESAIEYRPRLLKGTDDRWTIGIFRLGVFIECMCVFDTAEKAREAAERMGKREVVTIEA